MGSFRENCEITEEKDEQRTSWQERNDKPPFPKKGYNKSLQDDINKLFESVNLRSSKSVDLSDARRNNSKRPMRAGNGTNSPVIGFSEPVSLKQALRGLCISQAAEMATIKRMSLPASPRVSEAGKFRNVHSSILAETSESGYSSNDSRGRKIEISLVPEENSSSSSSHTVSSLVRPVVEKLEHNSSGDAGIAIDRCSAKRLPTESVLQNEIKTSPEFDVQLASPPPHDNARDDIPKQEQKISGSVEIEKPALKLLRRKKSSSVVKGNKEGKHSIKRTSRAVKPVIINKNLVIRKPKKVAMPKDLNVVQDDRSEPLICHKCQCSLKETVEKETPVVKIKPDISQSSKSSICEFSSSTTTSLSDESNMSGSNCGNSRPHMSKDARWEAISLVRKQYGFLGLSHFNLLKKLGSGDIGTVYLAELVGTGCPFAIKVMDNEFLGKRKKMGRAQTEREILRMLDHPFLPTLYAQFTSDNLSCLVMEFCPGGDLHVLRQKQPARYFPEYAARFYVAEVLLALEYLHMLGIVYRDLKPENILVREDGHIMLTDFDLSLRCSVNPTLVKSSSPSAIEPPRISGPCTGSSCIDPFCAGPSCKMSCFSPRLLHSTAAARARKRKEAETIAAARSLPQLVAEPTEARSNSFVGTHEYLAPEIIKGEGHGSAVDWWTLGVFLYELLYGKTPFKGADNDETLSNVVVKELRFPNTPIVSFQARDLIRGLLAKDPASRVGIETGAAEIKRHPFFEGLNWALIRCGSPPQVPEVCDVESLKMGLGEKGKGFLGCGGDEERVEFQLF